MKIFFGKVDYVHPPLLGEIEATIPCSFDFDLKKKKKKKSYIRPPAPS